ncbi:MAG: hypothetical protein IK077_16325 [Thermoguttaceae bacterium]|nr:hypothetical protein [Thermoguttaceae bacterium]
MAVARDEGRAQGRREGRVEGRSEAYSDFVEVLRQKGMSEDQIRFYLGDRFKG